MVDVKVNSQPMQDALTRFGAELGRAPELETAKKQIGILALQDIKRDFIRRSNPSDPTWPRLSAVTVVLRRRGRGGRIYSEADLAARRLRTPKLRDEGLLIASLTPGSPGNILETREMAIHVGTNRPGAGTQQDGGSTTFVFDAERQARFESNVSKTLRGRRPPPKLPDGHWNRWGQPRTGQRGGCHMRSEQSPWNRLYFILRGAMRKMSGTSRRVPARRFVEVPSEARLRKYGRQLEAGLAALARRLGM